MDKNASTIKLAENNNTPGSLVRPSSLNYKISLSEAVGDFIKKDMPLGEDQFIDVNLEDPKISINNTNNSSSSNKNNNQNIEHDEFDDMMWDMTIPGQVSSISRGQNNIVKTITKPGQVMP